MREVLRQEKKYLMSYEQFRKLDNTFEKVLHPVRCSSSLKMKRYLKMACLFWGFMGNSRLCSRITVVRKVHFGWQIPFSA